ncbi:MAG: heparan-alpha-glucosaminide N-acetyltransferase domain-containing protein, partial [Planctomycetota bacterium]
MENLLITQQETRSPKLDVVRSIAITLMIVDHSLLILLPSSSCTLIARSTLTRCAEPLFIFVLATLAIVLKRPTRFGRWFQIVLLSVGTSAILSCHLGYAVMDVLVSIALISPFTLLLIRLPNLFLYVSAGLAVVPISFQGIAMDYSPALLIHQVLLTKVAHQKGGQVLGPLAISSLVAFLTGAALSYWGVGLSPTLLVILIGQPLAILVVGLV